MQITLLFFGPMADAAETRIQYRKIAEQTSAQQVFDNIRSEFPTAAVNVKFAVNRQYSNGIEILKEGDEIAVIPPVSGG